MFLSILGILSDSQYEELMNMCFELGIVPINQPPSSPQLIISDDEEINEVFSKFIYKYYISIQFVFKL